MEYCMQDAGRSGHPTEERWIHWMRWLLCWAWLGPKRYWRMYSSWQQIAASLLPTYHLVACPASCSLLAARRGTSARSAADPPCRCANCCASVHQHSIRMRSEPQRHSGCICIIIFSTSAPDVLIEMRRAFGEVESGGPGFPGDP